MRTTSLIHLVLALSLAVLPGCGGGGGSAGYALGGGSTTTYSASGNIVTSDGTPLPEVSVALTGSVNASTTTDVNGHYSFSGLGAGSYTVTPALLDFTFDPTSASFSISSSNSTSLNFIATSYPASTQLITTHVATLRSQTTARFLSAERVLACSAEAGGTLGTADHCTQSRTDYESHIQSFLNESLAYIQSVSHTMAIDKNAILALLNSQKASDKAYSDTYYSGVCSRESAQDVSNLTSGISTDLDNMYSRVSSQVQTL